MRCAGPIFLAVCGNTPAFAVQVVRPGGGKSGGSITCAPPAACVAPRARR
jgi:hypothetical protein